MSTPLIAKAWVTGQDPDNEAVFVTVSSVYGGAGPTLSCQVLTHGPRDGVVGRFPALPTAGTHGLVVFPSQDNRNGIWLGAISTQLTDASAHAPGNGAADYAAHYGGGWSYRSPDGQITEVLPDGTTLQIGPTVPAPTRHTIDAQQARQRTAFTATQRRPQTPSAYPVSLTHPTGASAVLSATGGWHMTAASGQTLVLDANGASFTIDASGNVTIAAVSTLTVQAPSAVFTGTITATGRIKGANGVDLDAHVHANSGGTGNSGPPVANT